MFSEFILDIIKDISIIAVFITTIFGVYQKMTKNKIEEQSKKLVELLDKQNKDAEKNLCNYMEVLEGQNKVGQQLIEQMGLIMIDNKTSNLIVSDKIHYMQTNYDNMKKQMQDYSSELHIIKNEVELMKAKIGNNKKKI